SCLPARRSCHRSGLGVVSHQQVRRGQARRRGTLRRTARAGGRNKGGRREESGEALMRGSIVKRKSGYAGVIDAPPGPDGKRRQKWHKAGKTRKEAERLLAELVGSVHTGSYVSPSRLTVEAYLTCRWLPAMVATLKPSTHELYSTLVRAYVVP